MIQYNHGRPNPAFEPKVKSYFVEQPQAPATQQKQADNPYRPSYRAPILQEVERYLLSRQITATHFGELALGDPNLVRQLREGRDPRSKTVAIIRRFMVGEA